MKEKLADIQTQTILISIFVKVIEEAVTKGIVVGIWSTYDIYDDDDAIGNFLMMTIINMMMVITIMKVSVGHTEAGIDLGQKAVDKGATMVDNHNPMMNI